MGGAGTIFFSADDAPSAAERVDLDAPADGAGGLGDSASGTDLPLSVMVVRQSPDTQLETSAPSFLVTRGGQARRAIGDLVISDGALLDCESMWVGMRTVAIADGLLCVNGQPITIRGVNRHL